MSHGVFEGDSTGCPRASFRSSSVAASQVYLFCPGPLSSTVTEAWAWPGAHCQLLFLSPRKELERIPEELGRMEVWVVRDPPLSLLPTRVAPCPGGDGEMLLGHVAPRPSESGTADRHDAQLCSGLPILPRSQELLSIQTPVTGVLQRVGGSWPLGLFPSLLHLQCSWSSSPSESSELPVTLLVIQPCPQCGLEPAGSTPWAVSTCMGAGGGGHPGEQARGSAGRWASLESCI